MSIEGRRGWGPAKVNDSVSTPPVAVLSGRFRVQSSRVPRASTVTSAGGDMALATAPAGSLTVVVMVSGTKVSCDSSDAGAATGSEAGTGSWSPRLISGM